MSVSAKRTTLEIVSNTGSELLARATTPSTTSRRSSRESNKCAGNWACNMRLRRTPVGCTSICRADQPQCHLRTRTSQANSKVDSMDNSLKVDTNKADILDSITKVNNRIMASSNSTVTSRMAKMTRWRSWQRSCCRSCSRNWMDAVLSCKQVWVRHMEH